jgi:hypothetical protein
MAKAKLSASAYDLDASKIGDALENVLLEILSIRRERELSKQGKPIKLKLINVMSEWEGKPVPSRTESSLKALSDPSQCREEMAIRTLYWLGELLNKRGGSDLMQNACFYVSALHPEREQSIMDICSKRWDGIGDWFA